MVVTMLIDTNNLIAMTEANQNFSKVTRLVDETGMAVILKNSKPKYVLVKFNEYDEIRKTKELRAKNIEQATSALIDENLEAFLELAK